jgi:hypothetical protein
MGLAVVASAVIASSDDKHEHYGENCDDAESFHVSGLLML